MIDLTITSDPDKDGNYKLQCPQCLICENCHHAAEPLMFIYTANKEQADAMVMNYAEREMKNMLKKAFRGSKYIKIK